MKHSGKGIRQLMAFKVVQLNDRCCYSFQMKLITIKMMLKPHMATEQHILKGVMVLGSPLQENSLTWHFLIPLGFIQGSKTYSPS